MKTKKYFLAVYIIMILIVCAILSWVAPHFDGVSAADTAVSATVSMDDGWYDASGNEIDASDLGQLDYVKPGEEFSIYHQISEDCDGKTLGFRSKNVMFDAYIDNQLIYESYKADGVLNSKAVGTNWHYIDLSSEYAGSVIELRITTVYEDAKACIDNIYYGLGRGILLYTIKDKLLALITGVLCLFVGILLIFADIPANKTLDKNHELLYLGLLVVNMSIWCLLETYILQIFTGDGKWVHIASFCFLMLMPIPMVLYLYESYGEGMKYAAAIISTMSVLEFFGNVTMQLTGKADFQQTVFITHITLIAAALILIVVVAYHSVSDRRNSKDRFYKLIREIGLASVAITAFIDVLRFRSNGSYDPAKYVRIGILIFVVCYGFSSLGRTVEAVKIGAQAELISQLAYKDGLTGIGNRTAFNERIEELKEECRVNEPVIAILMFDVNNLKHVNDELGHQTGDSMLVNSAAAIKNSFEQFGECYRIGGDEFVVIISSEDAESKCKAGMTEFNSYLQKLNQRPDKEYTLSIASGYSIYNHKRIGVSIMDVYKEADDRMYANKKEIKEKERLQQGLNI